MTTDWYLAKTGLRVGGWQDEREEEREEKKSEHLFFVAPSFRQPPQNKNKKRSAHLTARLASRHASCMTGSGTEGILSSNGSIITEKPEVG